MSPIISVKNLRKTYGKVVAVDDISFEIEEGEIFGLLGPNGAGKTTTVECLQALRHPDSGEIHVCGLSPIHEAQACRQVVGSQLQESALPDHIKVWEALDLFASVSSDSADWHNLLEQWGLARKSVQHSPAFPAASGSVCLSPWRWSIIPGSFSSTK